MNSKLSKKLLACFLTALGLSANSLNVSAKHGQTRENIKFYFGKKCKKLDERNELDKLANVIESFLSVKNVMNPCNVNNSSGKALNYFIELAKNLYKNLYEIQSRRSKMRYTSRLANSLNKILKNCHPLCYIIKDKDEVQVEVKKEYSGNENESKLAVALKDWIKNDILGIGNKNNNGIEVGNFSVWERDGKLVCALKELVQNKNLLRILESNCNTDQLNSGRLTQNTSHKATDNEIIEKWNVSGGIECYLYKDGHLIIKGTKKNTNVPSVILNNFVESKEADKVRNSVKSISFEGDIASIGNDAFNSFENLASINIPDSVTTIGEQAFLNCEKLTSVNIPDSVTTIGEQAFWGCKKLAFINIPNSVTTIGENAFALCDNLTLKISKKHLHIRDIVDKLENSGVKKIEYEKI